MTPQMMLEIVLEHARRGAIFLRDDRGIPAFRVGPDTDLLGQLIPLSLYYSTPKIESMNTYGLCDGGVWTRDELEVINRIDHVQTFRDEDEWADALQELLDEYVERS